MLSNLLSRRTGNQPTCSFQTEDWIILMVVRRFRLRPTDRPNWRNKYDFITSNWCNRKLSEPRNIQIRIDLEKRQFGVLNRKCLMKSSNRTLWMKCSELYFSNLNDYHSEPQINLNGLIQVRIINEIKIQWKIVESLRSRRRNNSGESIW